MHGHDFIMAATAQGQQNFSLVHVCHCWLKIENEVPFFLSILHSVMSDHDSRCGCGRTTSVSR